MESHNDIENNNRKLALIEESITRTLLYDDDKTENKYLESSFTMTSIYFCLGFGIIILIIVIIVIILKKI